MLIHYTNYKKYIVFLGNIYIYIYIISNIYNGIDIDTYKKKEKKKIDIDLLNNNTKIGYK